MKALQQQQRATAKVELKHYSSTQSRPGDVAFGFGNVTTGQVSSRKYEILTRASSVGRFEDREGLNPDLIQVSLSARASPAPPMQMKTMATDEVESTMSVQVSSSDLAYALLKLSYRKVLPECFIWYRSISNGILVTFFNILLAFLHLG